LSHGAGYGGSDNAASRSEEHRRAQLQQSVLQRGTGIHTCQPIDEQT